MSVQAGIDLSVELGSLRQEIRDNRRRDEERARALQPWPIRIPMSGSVATGDLALSFGGPDPGFYWMLHGMTAGGVAPSTVAAGTGELYVTGLGSAPGGPHTYNTIRLTADLVDRYASLPAVAVYGDDVIIVQANETLVLVVHSPTASQTYVAMARLHVYREQSSALEFRG